jgi:N-dimethylarginine dimethylaminohydrolase
MEGNVGRAERSVALAQWEPLRRTLESRVGVELVDPVLGLPDMVFTANAGLVRNQTFIPARFRFRERQPETAHYVEWFRRAGYAIAELDPDCTFEGEGDALFQPGEPVLWAGYGLRSSLQAHHTLAARLGVEVVTLRLIDERFYHLDTCFCPLPGGRVIYYPGAFDHDSLQAIRARVPGARRFEVDVSVAVAFGCNAVCAGDAFITNCVDDALRERLAAWGFEAIVLPLDEFILAGGAAKCLALNLSHR